MAVSTRTPLVFVPFIGFRSAATRVLRGTTESTIDGVCLRVVSGAAARDRTDLFVEWECATELCTSDTPPPAPLVHGASLETLDASLTAGTLLLGAAPTQRSSYSYGSLVQARHQLTFAALPPTVELSELRVRDAGREWRVPLRFDEIAPMGHTNAGAAEHHGVLVRATAVARVGDEVAVEVEVTSALEIRQVAAPVPTPVNYSRDDPRVAIERLAEFRRVFGGQADPIVLESDGRRLEEMRRIFVPNDRQQRSDGRFVSRFTAFFPGVPLVHAALHIPFVALNDREPSRTVDLRTVPHDVKLAAHEFRVLRLEPEGADQRLVLQLRNQQAQPRFAQPMRVYGRDASAFGWQAEAAPDQPGVVAMRAPLGDGRIVTFQGAVVRVETPWVLALSD